MLVCCQRVLATFFSLCLTSSLRIVRPIEVCATFRTVPAKEGTKNYSDLVKSRGNGCKVAGSVLIV